ncbi:MAG: lysine--tRNA ligase, partial [Pseudomonadota bacterium]
RMLEVYDDVLDIILPTLGEERRATYSPILPISPTTGRVLYVPLLERDAASGTIVFQDEDGSKVVTSVKGGACKMQWKADWAGRWHALGVDYEMSGEDLTESVRLSNRIVTALGGTPPAGFNYQLFLDEDGKKISKTKGNGITIDEWLTYASPESLSLYMFQQPKKAKKLYFDIIPKTADEYLSHLAKYPEQESEKALDNPVWHIHEGDPPAPVGDITFAMLMNLVSATGTDDKSVIWGFVQKYVPGTSPGTHPKIDELIGYALNYFDAFVRPTLTFRTPTGQERAALEDLIARLGALQPETADADALQTEVFSAGKSQNFENLRDWFTAIYEVVFGQSQGPRMGVFIAVYGVEPTVALLKDALAREA